MHEERNKTRMTERERREENESEWWGGREEMTERDRASEGERGSKKESKK